MTSKGIYKNSKNDTVITREVLSQELSVYKQSIDERFDFLMETLDEKFTILTGVMVEKIHDMFKATVESTNMRIEIANRQLEEMRKMNARIDYRVTKLESGLL